MWRQLAFRVLLVWVALDWVEMVAPQNCGSNLLRADDGIAIDHAANEREDLGAVEWQPSLVLPKFAEKVRVQVDGEDLLLSKAVRLAAADPQLTEYRRLRATHGATAEGQLNLARWCRRRGLFAEERLHWRILLSFQPDQPEAIKRLGLRRYRGDLLTPDEIVEAKKKDKQLKKAAETWTPRLKRILRAMKRGDVSEREAAIHDLNSIQDPLAIPTIVEVFSMEDPDIIEYVVDFFAALPDRQATEFIVRQAVLSESPEIRAEAIRTLSYRPYEDYVPMLIAGLAAPIELSTQLSKKPGGLKFQSYRGYEYTGRVRPTFLHRIRLSGNYSADDVATVGREAREVSGTVVTRSPDRYRLHYSLFRESPDPDSPYEFTGEMESTDDSVFTSAADLERRIQKNNAASARHNQRIHEALKAATGEEVAPNQFQAANGDEAGVDPRPWWDWWRRKLDVNNYFAAGSEIWTQTGPLPIEQILLGDRVLTRDSESGELTFNMVVGLDIQQQSNMHRIEVDGRTIVTTPEQPFFSPNGGKRRARDIQEGTLLNSLDGPRRVAEVGAGAAIATYSLIVEDSSNYFVDRLGIQVSDSTPVREGW